MQKQAETVGQGNSAPATPNAKTLIKIGTKTYAGADHIVALLGITRRTLNRWTQDRKGPPKIVIGQRVLYDLDKFAIWLESNEIRPLPQHGVAS